jgi:hypothetical protein
MDFVESPPGEISSLTPTPHCQRPYSARDLPDWVTLHTEKKKQIKISLSCGLMAPEEGKKERRLTESHMFNSFQSQSNKFPPPHTHTSSHTGRSKMSKRLTTRPELLHELKFPTGKHEAWKWRFLQQKLPVIEGYPVRDCKTACSCGQSLLLA